MSQINTRANPRDSLAENKHVPVRLVTRHLCEHHSSLSNMSLTGLGLLVETGQLGSFLRGSVVGIRLMLDADFEFQATATVRHVSSIAHSHAFMAVGIEFHPLSNAARQRLRYFIEACRVSNTLPDFLSLS